MRSVDPVTAQFLADAPVKGLITRQMVSILATHRVTRVEEWLCFWTGLDTYAANVISGETNLPVNRTFAGDGSIIRVGKTTRRSGLEYKNKTVTLSMAHPAVELLARGYDLRMAPVEFHIAILDPASHLFVAVPAVDYMGFISDPSDTRPGPGNEGGITLSCLSHAVELTSTNPLRRTHAVQSQRGGDGLYKYIGIMGEVQVPWGQ